MAKKTTAKKATAKKAAAKAPVATETTAAKTAAAAKKTVAKKTVAKKAAGKKTVAKRTPARKPAAKKAVKAAVPVEVAVSPSLDADDRERLLAGTHHDPHSVLGAHSVPGGVAFRAFRPYALAVTVLSGELRVELHDDGDGFFSGLVPIQEVPVHRLPGDVRGGRPRRWTTRTASCPRWATWTCI